jgi:uncharacterized protein YdeI (YjbR/CyaY-like superfamily)
MTKANVAILLFPMRDDFRAWLKENAETSEGVWLVFGKTKADVTLSANDALEEALCFGWIDGQIQSIDENTYRKYFKQRKTASNWSEKNKNLVTELESKGMMTDFGRVKVAAAKKNGQWDAAKKDELTEDHLQAFEDMLKPLETAYKNFMKMPKSARKAYAGSYIFGAKTEEGKQKRFTSIAERLTSI